MVIAKKRKIHRILAIKNRAIGDTVLLTGPLRLLKQHYPDHQLHVLARFPGGQLLEGLPFIDRVICAHEPKGSLDRMAYWFRMIKRLREQFYSMTLNFHASFRTSLTAKLLRTDYCVANHHEIKGRNWFSDIPIPGRGVVKPVIDRDLDLLRAIGIAAHLQDAMPELKLYDFEEQDAQKLLAEKINQQNLNQSHSAVRVFLGIGASRPTKIWNPHHFAEIVERIEKEFNALFVICSTNADELWLNTFLSLMSSTPKLYERILIFKNLNLRQAAAILSLCNCYVGNDSGLKHVAIALGLRSFTIFGPEGPLEWHPYNQKNHPYAFIDHLACRTETGKHWCPIQTCTRYQNQCMNHITPDQVWESVASVLKK